MAASSTSSTSSIKSKSKSKSKSKPTLTLAELQKKSHELWKQTLGNIHYERENETTFKQIQDLAKCKSTHDKMCESRKKKALSENVDEIARLKIQHKQLYPEYCYEKQEIKDQIRKLEDERIEIKCYYDRQITLCYGVNTINACNNNNNNINTGCEYESLLCYTVYYNSPTILDYLLTNKANPNIKKNHNFLLPIELAIKRGYENMAIKLLSFSNMFEEFKDVNLMASSIYGAAEKAGMTKLVKLITDEVNNKKLNV